MTDNLFPKLLLGGQSEAEIYEAIGRFVTRYALAEAALHVAAWQIVGLGETEGRVIFSGMRVSDIAKRVRGMFELGGPPETVQQDFEACYKQLDLISKARDRVVHHAADYEQGRLKLTNYINARFEHKAETHEYTLDELQQLRNDCGAIALRFFAMMAHDPGDQEMGLYLAREPWRYKPG